MPPAKPSLVYPRKVHAVAMAVRNGQRRAIERCALEAKRIEEREFAASGVSRGSRIAGRPWRGVRYDVRQGRDTAWAKVVALPPIHLVTNPTRPHFISPKGLVGSKARRSASLMGQWRMAEATGTLGRFNTGRYRRNWSGPRNLAFSGIYRRWSYHPGTAGSGALTRAKRTVARRTPEVYARELSPGIRRAFRSAVAA